MAPPLRKGSSSKGKGNVPKGTKNPPWSCLGCDNAIDDGDETIECHACKNWCHRQCSELSEAQFAVLARGGESVLWQCGNCIEKVTNGESPNASRTEAKLDVIMKMFQEMITRMEKLEGMQNGKSTDDKIEDAVERKMTLIVEEAREKDKRKQNIIIANLPESTEVMLEERKREDRVRVRVLVSKITDVPGADIDEPMRLGQMQIGYNARPRLLRMVVRTDDAKQKIMKNVYSLNEGIPFDKRVYINNDCTPLERENYKALKAEMARRVEGGEKDLIIRNMKIVKRQPRQFPGQKKNL